MKCPECGTDVFEDDKKCPSCGNKKFLAEVSSNETFRNNLELLEKMEDNLSKTIELKTTKKKKIDESDVSLEETIAINAINQSLLDDINNQIDSINEDAKREEEKIKQLLAEAEHLNTSESFSKRRRVLIITAIFSMLFMFAISVVYIFSEYYLAEPGVPVEFSDSLKSALNNYYETNDIEPIVTLLEQSKRNEERVLELQFEVKISCQNWILRYSQTEVKNKKEFENLSVKYRKLIDDLYTYAIVKNEVHSIRALNEPDYDELIEQFNDIYSDGIVFYEAMDYYNTKDYNKAYYMFNKLEENNSYYDDSVKYINSVYERIIELLEKDIEKITKDIGTLSNEDKLSIYILVEETIIEYNNVYDVDLDNNSEYQEILNFYSNKVNEYNYIVYEN